MNWTIDLSLIGVVIGMLTCPSPKGGGILFVVCAPSAHAGTSPKYDILILAVIKTFPVVFGGRVPERMRVVGRVGAVLRKSI